MSTYLSRSTSSVGAPSTTLCRDMGRKEHNRRAAFLMVRSATPHVSLNPPSWALSKYTLFPTHINVRICLLFNLSLHQRRRCGSGGGGEAEAVGGGALVSDLLWATTLDRAAAARPRRPVLGLRAPGLRHDGGMPVLPKQGRGGECGRSHICQHSKTTVAHYAVSFRCAALLGPRSAVPIPDIISCPNIAR